MDLNVIYPTKLLSPEAGADEKNSGGGECGPEKPPAVLLETACQALSSLQKTESELGFICLELLNPEELAEQFGPECLGMILRHVETIGIEEFSRHFPPCRLHFAQPIGMQHCLLCFTLREKTRETIWEQYGLYSLGVNRAIKSLSPHPYRIAVGMAVIAADGERTDPNAMAARGFWAARKTAKTGPGASWAALYRAFRDIREERRIRMLYQPVIDLHNGSRIGWEALARGPETTFFQGPLELFEFSEKVGEARDLDHLCRCLAVEKAAGLAPDKRLFINLHPHCLHHPEYKLAEFIRRVRENNLENHQIILDISEKTGIAGTDRSWLLEKLEFYRASGFLLCLDDTGSGGASIAALTELRPDFIKLDHSTVKSIDTCTDKRILAESLVLLAEKIGAQVIAEGVERKEELSALSAIGVYGGQGFYFAEPGPDFGPIDAKITVRPLAIDTQKDEWQDASPIRDLAKEATRADIKTPISQVKKQLGEDSPMKSVVITQTEKPVGLLMSYSLDSHLSSMYGPSLYYHRPVSAIMDKHPLIAESSELVERVAKRAMNREARKVYDDIIVTEKGRLLGTVSVQDMMDVLAKVQVELAKGANPLTGLPGNVMIEMEINRRKKKKIRSSFLYLDLDNFKVYNDVYGFQKGDSVLKMTARVMKQAASKAGAASNFIGHIGGDDFILITDPRHAEAAAQTITELFAEQIPGMYNEADQRRGYIIGVSRDGREGRFPFISVSIGIIDCTFEHPISLEDLSERAANVKKYAKSRPGNVYVKDRRPALGSAPKQPVS
jgi:diguanylate cyclase (GGDEF)-like protein